MLAIDAYTNLDQTLADFLYHWQGHAWSLRHTRITEAVIREGGRRLVGLMVLSLLNALGFSNRSDALRPYRGGLIYLVFAVVLSFALVGGLKAVSGAACPWDLVRDGGTIPLEHWFSGFSSSGGCSPAGHASGGYEWVTLYYS